MGLFNFKTTLLKQKLLISTYMPMSTTITCYNVTLYWRWSSDRLYFSHCTLSSFTTLSIGGRKYRWLQGVENLSKRGHKKKFRPFQMIVYNYIKLAIIMFENTLMLCLYTPISAFKVSDYKNQKMKIWLRKCVFWEMISKSMTHFFVLILNESRSLFSFWLC